jgi:transposase
MTKPILPDGLWERIEPLLPKDETERHIQYAGRKPAEARKVMTGIIFALGTGVPWKDLPATSDFPSGHTCRRRLLEWQEQDVWQKLLENLLSELRSKDRLDLGLSVIDSSSIRATHGGEKTGKNPTDRAKLGSKHHLLVERHGIPLSVRLTGANRHDITELLNLVEKIPAIAGKSGHPRQKPKIVQGDRGYDSEPHRLALKQGDKAAAG